MLIVEVKVNQRTILKATARRIHGSTDPNSIGEYTVNESAIILPHRYGDGAQALVKALIPYLEEVKP